MQHLYANGRLSDLQAIFKLIPKEEQSKLPEDENTPEKRANKLWAFFEKKDNGETRRTSSKEPTRTECHPYVIVHTVEREKKNAAAAVLHPSRTDYISHQLFGLMIIQVMMESPRATVTASSLLCEMYFARHCFRLADAQNDLYVCYHLTSAHAHAHAHAALKTGSLRVS